jgi:alkylhydroperoxidase family enzyme
MTDFDYSEADVPVRDDLRDAHRFLWEHLGSPGTWWTGQQRVAIAAESRSATGCTLCRERKAALSPNAVRGSHDSLGELPEDVVETIHRIRTDPARLSKAWFDRVIASGLTEMQYVELVGVVTLLAGVDYFGRALGIGLFRLPAPLAGEPSRHRPESAKPGTGWVPMIAPEDADGPEVDLYGDTPFVPNIMRALSLVPDEARALQRSSNAHYVPVAQIGDPTVRKSLDRMQIELLAARVSALNECFY